MIGNNFVLWENDDFIVKTPFNPHVPYNEGLHIIVAPKSDIEAAWQDPAISGRAFELASRVSAIIKNIGLAPWLNIQANGNWGLLPDSTPFFHLHIYGRNKTHSWGRPIILPELPGAYKNDPMPEDDRDKVIEAMKSFTF